MKSCPKYKGGTIISPIVIMFQLSRAISNKRPQFTKIPLGRIEDQDM